MRPRRSFVFTAALAALMACTTAETPGPQPSTLPTSVPATSGASPTPVTTLVSGDPLPDGCDTAQPRVGQTVAFVAGSRAWALDPAGRRLTCLFDIEDPGPFAWGPQGDRVLLGGLEVRGLGPNTPSFDGTGAAPSAFDWGHPLGLAIVFAQEQDRTPEKRFMDDGRVEPLRSLPRGTYLSVAYHPSGLALAFVLEQERGQSIWLSTNEGTDPTRLVFSKGGTRFTSIAFTPDGTHLVWTAQHAADYPQIHSMDLTDRTTFDDGWRGEVGQFAGNLRLPPGGRLTAIDRGATCAEREALVVFSPNVVRPALPDETRPTTVLGWLDRTTLLVGAGGCGEPLDLYVADALDDAAPALLVTTAELGATRTVAPAAPDSVPAPPAEDPPPPTGVG